MNCKICGAEGRSIQGMLDHIHDHFNKYSTGEHGVSIRVFLICVKAFYGELPSTEHMNRFVKEAERELESEIPA